MGELVRFACRCGQKFAAPASQSGRKLRCQQCGAPLQVPPSLSRAGLGESATVSAKPMGYWSRQVRQTPEWAWGCLGWMLVIGACVVVGMLALPRTPTTTPARHFNAEQLPLAIEIIKEYPQVRDAAVARDPDGRRLNLAIVVGAATSRDHARELGDSFVRATINFVEGGRPGKEIGRSEWDYQIQVATPAGQVLARGAKIAEARRIAW